MEEKSWSPELKAFARTSLDLISLIRFRRIAPEIFDWSRTHEEIAKSGLVIHQIHGRNDRIAVPPSIKEATLLMRGEHLLHLSHSGEVIRWIDAIVKDRELRNEFRGKK